MSGFLVQTRQYVTPGDEPSVCSQCDQAADVLARLPLVGFLRGWRRLVGTAEQPWIGLCERCVRELLDGFAPARRLARAAEATEK